MAVTVTELTKGGSGTDQSSYMTSSYSPTAGRLVLACIYSGAATTPPEPTLSGNSLTWTKVRSHTHTLGGSTARLTVFRARAAAPTSGALTIDFGGSTQGDCMWIVNEFAGLDTRGTNGASAVVQSAHNDGSAVSSLTVTLSAFNRPTNPTFGFVTMREQPSVTPGSGFTEISEASGPHSIQTQWKASNDTSVDWSWGGNANYVIGIALELAASPAHGAFVFNMI